MNREISFDYYYGQEAEQYTFYRVPKVLFTDELFRGLSCEAKLLYGLLLDRMSLSMKNRWLDEEDKVYIVYTIDEIRDTLGCSKQKAVYYLQELDTKNGIGLIEKKRRGLGKANVIYVKNFLYATERNTREKGSETAENKGDLQKFHNGTSRSTDMEFQEVPNTNSNNTNINQTEISDTEILSIHEKEDFEIIQMDLIGCEERYVIRNLIHENIEYDSLCTIHGKNQVDEIVMIMEEVITSTCEEMVLGGRKVRSALLKSRFMKLNYSHIN